MGMSAIAKRIVRFPLNPCKGCGALRSHLVCGGFPRQAVHYWREASIDVSCCALQLYLDDSRVASYAFKIKNPRVDFRSCSVCYIAGVCPDRIGAR